MELDLNAKWQARYHQQGIRSICRIEVSNSSWDIKCVKGVLKNELCGVCVCTHTRWHISFI